MSTVIGEMLPLAIAVALSPLSIIALILILISRNARSNGPAYFIGWIVGLALAVTAMLALLSLINSAPASSPTTLSALLRVLLGALLLFLGVRQWRHLTKPGQEPSLPHWMASIDAFTPVQAFGLAVLLSAMSNLAIIIAAALTISRAKLDISQEIIAVAFFIVVSSLLVAFVVIYAALSRVRAAQMLTSWKAWLVAHNAALTSVLFMIVGALLLGKGISGLDLFG